MGQQFPSWDAACAEHNAVNTTTNNGNTNNHHTLLPSLPSSPPVQMTMDVLGRPTLLQVHNTAEQAVGDVRQLAEDLEALLDFLSRPELEVGLLNVYYTPSRGNLRSSTIGHPNACGKVLRLCCENHCTDGASLLTISRWMLLYGIMYTRTLRVPNVYLCMYAGHP